MILMISKLARAIIKALCWWEEENNELAKLLDR